MTEEHETLAADAEALAVVLTRSAEGQVETVRQLAALLADIRPLDGDAAANLARVLQVALDVVPKWFDQTVGCLVEATRYEPADPRWSVVSERLSLLSWAWGELPAEWPEEVHDLLLRGWAEEFSVDSDSESATSSDDR